MHAVWSLMRGRVEDAWIGRRFAVLFPMMQARQEAEAAAAGAPAGLQMQVWQPLLSVTTRFIQSRTHARVGGSPPCLVRGVSRAVFVCMFVCV